jgi:Family of unknown function (DUF5681)
MSYGSPPIHTRFRPGQSGNLKGRPKRNSKQFPELINGIFESDVEYVEDGRKKSLSRKELAVKQHIQKGIRGNLANIAALLVMRDEAKKSSLAKPKIIIENWVPDRPGQTGEQKTRETAAARSLERSATSGADNSKGIQLEGPSS